MGEVLADTRGEVAHSFNAMASVVNVRVIDPGPSAADCIEDVEATFRSIEKSCTRFDAASDLMRANAQPQEWSVVDPECLAAIELAYDAHVRTGGAFDPRTLTALTGMGYDRTLPFAEGVVTESAGQSQAHVRPWEPEFDAARSAVRLGDQPIDLGGIGKGYAVRRGIALLHGAGSSALVEAGGDLATYGPGPHRRGDEPRCWRASVEDPRGGDQPIAVLDASDAGVATSSIRLRTWRAGGKRVHHLIDPRTGQPSKGGLLAVTIVADDPAWAEVWTKECFLAGRDHIGAHARETGLAALWVTEEGRIDVSDAMKPRVLWRCDHG